MHSPGSASWPNVTFDYSGADVLVTGGTSGIGAGIAAAAENCELAFQRSTSLYKAGLTDFLHVLIDERAAYMAEDVATQSELESAIDAIALYKALGAGWQGIYPDDTLALHDATAPSPP